MKEGWIGVDLDGTLAFYDKWMGPTHVGAPIQKMVERVNRWIEQGYEVRIFTARIADGDPKTLKTIEDWSKTVFGFPFRVTNVKDFEMIELWDDRAVQVISNTGEPVGQSTRGLS